MKQHIFKSTIDHLWAHRDYYNQYSEFDYPFYGGIPTKINKTFSSEAVDAIQSIWIDFIDNHYKTKREFAAAYKTELKRIGEKII